MKVTLTGPSAKLFGKVELELNSRLKSIGEVREYLLSKKPGLTDYHMRFAVNSRLVEDPGQPGEEDSILVFHPFAGG
jgi:molybdopterin converting factor small subunit